jgi:hypothetical protein
VGETARLGGSRCLGELRMRCCYRSKMLIPSFLHCTTMVNASTRGWGRRGPPHREPPALGILTLQVTWVHPTSVHCYAGSHNRSCSGTSSPLAKASATTYEIPHLNIGGPSSLSGSDVRVRSLAFARSTICFVCQI